jgi:hypothetical protein
MNITTDNSAVIAGLNNRIAQLKKELSLTKDIIVAHQIADETGYIDGVGWVENWSEMKETVTSLVEAHNLEQQALACDWIYKNVPDLSNGNYMVIQNRSRQLRAEAKALKEQGK